MQATQLKLKLWEDLDRASATPETVNLVQLWQELEAALGLLPHEQRLGMAGKAIAQIVEVFALRSDLILSAWEEAHNEKGLVVDEDAIAGLVRQTMTLDLSGLMEKPDPEQRHPRTQPVRSLAGPVDKAALLEAFDSEIELVEAQAQAESAAGVVAHDEDVGGWARAIARWVATRSSTEPVFLIELQRGLGMPLIQIWMGLLLAREGSYQLVQQGEDFYAPQGISVVTLTPEVKLIELEELRTRRNHEHQC